MALAPPPYTHGTHTHTHTHAHTHSSSTAPPPPQPATSVDNGLLVLSNMTAAGQPAMGFCQNSQPTWSAYRDPRCVCACVCVPVCVCALCVRA